MNTSNPQENRMSARSLYLMLMRRRFARAFSDNCGYIKAIHVFNTGISDAVSPFSSEIIYLISFHPN